MSELETVHGPRCWGRTSLSEEVAHCYCQEPLTPLAPAQAWQARALAAEARVNVLEEALRRQTDNVAFVLNRVDLRGWTEKFTSELAEDRAALAALQQKDRT